MAEGNEARSPLLTHLLELRRVFVISLASVAVAFCVIFGFLIDYLMLWITSPIQAKGIQIIYTTMSEAFITKFKVAIIASVIVSSPVIIWQIWSFIKSADCSSLRLGYSWPGCSFVIRLCIGWRLISF